MAKSGGTVMRGLGEKRSLREGVAELLFNISLFPIFQRILLLSSLDSRSVHLSTGFSGFILPPFRILFRSQETFRV